MSRKPLGSHAKKKFPWRKRYVGSKSVTKLIAAEKKKAVRKRKKKSVEGQKVNRVVGSEADRLRESMLFHNDLNQRLREIGLLDKDDNPLRQAATDEPYMAYFYNTWTMSGSGTPYDSPAEPIGNWTLISNGYNITNFMQTGDDPSDIETRLNTLEAEGWAIRIRRWLYYQVTYSHTDPSPNAFGASDYCTLTNLGTGSLLATTYSMRIQMGSGYGEQASFGSMLLSDTGVVSRTTSGTTDPLYLDYPDYFPTAALRTTLFSDRTASSITGNLNMNVLVEIFP